MATLTYDPTPADQPEFNEAEVEALARGEAQAAEENKMLAGKYESAEELEKAYIELQKKLGENNGEERVRDQASSEEVKQEEPQAEVDPLIELLQSASEEYYNNDGELSKEMMDKLTEMDSRELLNAYISIQQNAAGPADFTEEQVADIQNFVGGEAAYGNLVNWATENMPQNYLQAFDNLVSVGDPDMIKLAVTGMQAAFQEANGYEGRMLTGKPAANPGKDVFRSQAEVVAAMNDPRYDKDPAYRQDVFAKLDRSDLNY
jgi:hypothetical protein